SRAFGTFGAIHDLLAQLAITRLLTKARERLCHVCSFHFAPWSLSGRRLAARREPESLWIELQQSRRLRGGIAKLEAQFHGGELGRGSGEQHITVAHGVQR